ncbi:MAG: hypothetical protein BGO55_05485 [Sphingobacteriales bacterium 50-39]|nr:hypothetical protein [Sphingobacteriales bacterium]OJW56050.1 MAG: hypothetical protein BGO55_05485 [Sphingobacteriales bacterium 50-39]
MDSYLQLASGDSAEAVSLRDIQNAIKTIREMDDEHGAFWVGIIEDDEIVLETHKDLTVIGFLPGMDGQEIRARMPNWIEVEQLYTLFLDQKFDAVKSILNISALPR